MAFAHQPFDYVAPAGLRAPEPRHKVIIVGAGPIGLAMAIELANHGVLATVLDDNNVVSVGSRAICWSKRSLEILDRLGVGERSVTKGVTWKVGRTFHRDKEVFNFDLLPEDGHKMPAFVNLQQYFVEEYLVQRAQALNIDLRWKNRVISVDQKADFASVKVVTPDGSYMLEADWVLACDGARSPIREMMGLEFDGELFEERFLIADIEMQGDFASERWFWFEPNFHPGQSALLHKQPDNIYRIDLQLGWDTDPEVEKRPETVSPRIEKVVGHADFKLDWISVYTFQCRRLRSFVHSNILFVGDSAHVVSPFGARGGNGGLGDVDALGWRLAAVINGVAAPEALQGYDRERCYGADENLLNSSRSTRFMSPEPGIERLFRDAVLHLAGRADFARPMVNSGRLSKPCIYPLVAPDADLPAGARPGAVAPDAPLENGWMTEALGRDFVLLALGCDAPELGLRVVKPVLTDMIRRRYLGDQPQAVYLIRPDQVVAARWLSVSAAGVAAALEQSWEG
ncbi:FAD-dependent monooxygenase [Cypionkella sp.]|uniref:FAD-dependent monooxygenase n=1 Tax=Cypionkella sp. TaxID=2811411 RepID=UPI002725DDB5|nr:FAD-dependent monooxygenase [Cypionkella sp.]MDO8984607.1 FAD-dependent monooxygenase [Cypionkella sp.]MDP2049360.1 FAD-dependent monooxygenase [Cypionkella sp.]